MILDEIVKKIVESEENLAKIDLEKMAEYLNDIFFNNKVKIRSIYTDDRFDMSFSPSKENIVILINYKYYLEKIKNEDKLTTIFKFIKSFIHEYIHVQRCFKWYSDKNECYNYTVESTIIREYFKQKGFDFYEKNRNWMLMELEAEIKSAMIMNKNIQSGEWTMFSNEKFTNLLSEQINKNNLLAIVRPFVVENNYYAIYDTGVIDVLLKIYQEDTNLLIRYPFLANIIDVKKDIIDMLFQYKSENLDLLRYLIVYLSEEHIFKKSNVLEHMSKLSDEEKKCCIEVIGDISAYEQKILKTILTKKNDITVLFDEKSNNRLIDIVEKNISERNNRILLLGEFADTIKSAKKNKI